MTGVTISILSTGTNLLNSFTLERIINGQVKIFKPNRQVLTTMLQVLHMWPIWCEKATRPVKIVWLKYFIQHMCQICQWYLNHSVVISRCLTLVSSFFSSKKEVL